MQTQPTNGNTSGPEIGLGQSSPDMGGLIAIGADRGPDYPDLVLRGDHSGLGEFPDKGEATIKFSKHAHEVANDGNGKKRHRVHLNVHSIKVTSSPKKKTVKDKNPFQEVPPAIQEMGRSIKNNSQ